MSVSSSRSILFCTKPAFWYWKMPLYNIKIKGKGKVVQIETSWINDPSGAKIIAWQKINKFSKHLKKYEGI